MKSILDAATRSELLTRISSLSTEAPAQWGKMNVYQMVRHCILCDDMYLGDLPIRRVWIGRLIGAMILKKILKDDSQFGRNSPTSALLKTVGESGDLEARKKEWAGRINGYADFDRSDFVHPFFGKMTKEQVGFMAYKHADHHLRQFGA